MALGRDREPMSEHTEPRSERIIHTEPGTVGEPMVETEETLVGRKGGEVAAYPAGAAVPAVTAEEAGEAAYLGHSRAEWGSIWAGFFVGLTTYLLLNALGAALGMTWLRGDAVTRGELQTAATTWLIITTLLSFFVGGYVTGRLMGLPGQRTGAMNGFLYGCLSIILLGIVSAVPAAAQMPNLMGLWGGMAGGGETAANMQQAAWLVFGGLLLSLAAATFGGIAGARRAYVDPLATGVEREHTVQRTRAHV